MSWWHQNNIRMIQNNLRDIDAMMDVDRHIEWIRNFHANVLQIGCGGITSFHPTKLTDFQWTNPYLRGDFIGEIIEKAHANGIRVIVRFDFSKTHESFYEKNGHWYQRSLDGSPIRYNDTISACINSEYVQNLALKAIEEVIRKYPADGIFFNMFGYQTRNYSGGYVGICQCVNCRQRFSEMYGESLPVEENPDDPVFRKYCGFKKFTIDDILTRIVSMTRGVNPEIAVSTYDPEAIDIVRDESNSALGRPLPFWIYQSSDNVGLIEGSFDDKVSSNVAINAVDIPYRFMGISDHLNRIRLYGNMAAGGFLDWCVIGSFDDYTDYENFEGVRKIYGFHEKYEKYYGHFDPKTKIMLVSNGMRDSAEPEYRGLFRMLKEEHIMFTVVKRNALKYKLEQFDDYDFILLPDIMEIDHETAGALRKTTACVIATKYSLSLNPSLVKDLFGVALGEFLTDVRGTYLLPEPREVFPIFHERKWVYLDKPYYKMRLDPGVKGLLPKVEKAGYGPPERCFGHAVTDESMASFGNGNIYIPWAVGSLYYEHGYDEFKKIFLALMRMARPVHRAIKTDAPEMVEMFFAPVGDSAYMLQMINMTGFNGITFFDSLPVSFDVSFTDILPNSIAELCDNGEKPVDFVDGKLRIHMLKSELYKAFLVKTGAAADELQWETAKS